MIAIRSDATAGRAEIGWRRVMVFVFQFPRVGVRVTAEEVVMRVALSGQLPVDVKQPEEQQHGRRRSAETGCRSFGSRQSRTRR